MGTSNKEKVQFVISHLEGCSGNFLGRLFACGNKRSRAKFRIDADLHPSVLAIDGTSHFDKCIQKLENHSVVVTHCYDRQLIKDTFPNARTVALYPYTHVGNVLYNICYKKLTNKIPNLVDNYLIHIKEWHAHLVAKQPAYPCHDFWGLTDVSLIESWLGITLNRAQMIFFEDYWKLQMMLPLDLPQSPKTIPELIEQWQCQDRFDKWLLAWTIYVYELINGLDESQRTWSIDTEEFTTWNDVARIQNKYNDVPQK